MDYSVGGRRLIGPSLFEPPFLGNAVAYAPKESDISEIVFMSSPDTMEALIPVIEGNCPSSCPRDWCTHEVVGTVVRHEP